MAKPWEYHGKVVVDADGRIVECDTCPCGVCPCSPWPPASWPCGGLKQTYSLSGFRQVNINGIKYDERILPSNATLTATSTPCTWEGSINSPQRIFLQDGRICVQYNSVWQWQLKLTPGNKWKLSVLNNGDNEFAETFPEYDTGPVRVYVFPAYNQPNKNPGCGWPNPSTFNVQEMTFTIA